MMILYMCLLYRLLEGSSFLLIFTVSCKKLPDSAALATSVLKWHLSKFIINVASNYFNMDKIF